LVNLASKTIATNACDRPTFD